MPEGVDAEPPLVTLIHGGGWEAGDRSQYHASCRALVHHGYAAATIGYRFRPDVLWPVPALDVLKGMIFLRERAGDFGYRGEKTVLLGSSAGGHMALIIQALGGSWAEKSRFPEIVGVIAQCPVVQIPCPPDKCQNSQINRLLEPGQSNADASPLAIDPGLFRNVLILHGSVDKIIPLETVFEFRDRLQTAGTECRLEIIHNAGHGFAYDLNNPQAVEAMDYALAFLKKHLPDK